MAGHRAWIRLWTNEWIDGDIRDETPAFRGIWSDLLALAGTGRYGDDGVIKAGSNVPFYDEQIAKILKLGFEEWMEKKQRFIAANMISCTPENIITIINWRKYQSEYERQKSYRKKKKKGDKGKLQPQVTTGTTSEGDGEKEKEKEKEKENRKRKDVSKEELDLYDKVLQFFTPSIDHRLEVEKFYSWWDGKGMKDPKRALRNWMVRAELMAESRSATNQQVAPAAVYVKQYWDNVPLE